MTHAYAGAISTKDAGGTNGTLNILLKFVTKITLNLVYYSTVVLNEQRYLQPI